MRTWLCLLIVPLALATLAPIADGLQAYLPDENFTKVVDGEVYEINYRTALGVLEKASELEAIGYKLKAWDWGLFVDCIKGICARNGSGWMYWVNYPVEDMPMVSASNYVLNEGDIVTWYYAETWEDTPATSRCVVNVTVEEGYTINVSVNCTIQWMAYDTNPTDGKIQNDELLSAIMDWLGDKITDTDLLNVIMKWLES